MQNYDCVHSIRLQRDAEGNLCPHIQLRTDLDRILAKASTAGAEVIITGDFNEKWSERGPYRQWMEQNGLVNLLTPDSITGGSTTCFPRGGDPSDIDWALCTHSLYNAGAVRAGVLHEKIGISAHCPIFISVKTKLWLQLSDGDVTNCKTIRGQSHQRRAEGQKSNHVPKAHCQALGKKWLL